MEAGANSLTDHASADEWVRVVEPAICAVEAGAVDWFWPRVSHWIDDALHQSVMHELPLDEVYTGCKDGSYLLLAVRLGNDLTGCAVMAASTDPQGRPYLAVICCGGERVQRWLSLLVRTCRLLAAEMGAREIVALGRPGWRPLLAGLGCKLRAVVMVLDVEGERDG
jgi:hypothetical protein